jgi:hypothetical protein
MAKMFYTLDETKAALGKSEDEIRQMVKDAQLREFRDGPRLMFKADQVESLKTQLGGAGGSDDIQLSSDSGAPLGLADSKTGSGTGIAFPPVEPPSQLPPQPSSLPGSGSGVLDVGLSASLGGSMGGASLAGSIGGSLPGMGGGAAKTPGKPGVNVFGDEADENADPMAQTHIAPARDQISLEGVGSGSGLLDLTRETDDTSLGAALLDEISPGGSKRSHAGVQPPSSSGSTAGMPVPELEPSAVIEDRGGPTIYGAAPVYITASDPMAPAFVGASIGALVVLLVGTLVLINGIVDSSPFVDARFSFVAGIATWTNALAKLFLVGLGTVVVFFVAGLLVGKMGHRQTA